MSNDVDAVIAALRIALNEAETRDDYWWKIHVVNRWIDQLPGRWRGKWRHLRLRGDNHNGTDATRANLIAHVRAMLAYLETNRDAIAAQSRWWPLAKAARQAAAKRNEVAVDASAAAPEKPSEVEPAEVTTPRRKWLH